MRGTWFWRLLVYLDKAVNDKLLRGRWETVSGRCYRRMLGKKCPICTWLCKMLDKVDPNHCEKAFFADRVKNPTLPWID